VPTLPTATAEPFRASLVLSARGALKLPGAKEARTLPLPWPLALAPRVPSSVWPSLLRNRPCTQYPPQLPWFTHTKWLFFTGRRSQRQIKHFPEACRSKQHQGCLSYVAFRRCSPFLFLRAWHRAHSALASFSEAGQQGRAATLSPPRAPPASPSQAQPVGFPR